jgi:hypothetical protein
VTFELVPVQNGEKQILANLLEKYNYEFSQYDSRDVNKLGLYGYDYLDSYWTKPDHFAFFNRRHGIGKNAAFKLFNMFSGTWEVYLYPCNTPFIETGHLTISFHFFINFGYVGHIAQLYGKLKN